MQILIMFLIVIMFLLFNIQNVLLRTKYPKYDSVIHPLQIVQYKYHDCCIGSLMRAKVFSSNPSFPVWSIALALGSSWYILARPDLGSEYLVPHESIHVSPVGVWKIAIYVRHSPQSVVTYQYHNENKRVVSSVTSIQKSLIFGAGVDLETGTHNVILMIWAVECASHRRTIQSYSFVTIHFAWQSQW